VCRAAPRATVAPDGDVDRRLARVFAPPLRQRLLFEYASPVSQSEVAAELGERLNLVA
jgi:hypothetical protein